MQTAFLIIISLLGSLYALVSKKIKMALGFFVMTLAFSLQIPNLVSGFWADIFLALSLMFFAVGVWIIISKDKINVVKENINQEADSFVEKEKNEK